MLQILLISSIIYVMTKVVSRMYRKMDYRSFRLLVFIFFFTYALGNIYFTILSRTAMSERLIELLPFASYGRIFDESTAVSGNKLNGWLAGFFLNTNNPAEGIILNILLYIPLGYLLPITVPKMTYKQVILVSFIATLCTEIIQLIWKLGWCETDDVLHNLTGAFIGLWIYHRQLRLSGAEVR